MNLLDRVKQFLTGAELPPEAREKLEKALNYRDLLEALDRVCTANEVKLRELELEIGKLEAVERSEIDQLKEEDITDRHKKIVLQRVQRIRRQISLLDDKIDIHTKNIELHQNLMGKIQRIESMSLQAVDDDLISEVVTDFEDQFEKYRAVLHTGDAAEQRVVSPLSTRDRVELKRLEEELLGKKEKPVAETEKAAANTAAEKEADSRPAARDEKRREESREREMELE